MILHMLSVKVDKLKFVSVARKCLRVSSLLPLVYCTCGSFSVHIHKTQLTQNGKSATVFKMAGQVGLLN